MFQKVSFLIVLLTISSLSSAVLAQTRPRVVGNSDSSATKKTNPSVETETKPTSNFPVSPTTDKPKVVRSIYQLPKVETRPKTDYVQPTVITKPTNTSSMSAFRSRLLSAMNLRLGIPYRYGSTGPNSFDCSGLVWTIFREAGIDFERSSASTYWSRFDKADDDEKYQFGTLVFFNGLGHVGIVIDENTFFHASSSKGVTFSKFEGYWSKRIVGFRRVPLD
jgi:cell wall-associated NlpC family hydrolase